MKLSLPNATPLRLFWYPTTGITCTDHAIPPVELRITLPPVATNRPSPYATPNNQLLVGLASDTQLTASVEVRIVPHSPTATYFPPPQHTSNIHWPVESNCEAQFTPS